MNRSRLWAALASVVLTGGLIVASTAIAQEQLEPPAPVQTPAPAPAVLDGPDTATGDTSPKAPTLYELFQFGLYINVPILVLSVIALVMFLFLLLALTMGGFAPRRLVENLSRLIINRQFDQAVHLCQSNSGIFIAPIMQRVLDNREREHAALIEIVAAEGRRRAEPIWNRINYLSEISNVAPMLGLLGTVLGMIQVFFTLTTRTVGEKAAELASGIGMAMGTTLFGLIVAIASAAFYAILRSRATAVLAEAELVCHNLADETARASVDPRLKKIDALADAARQKIALAAAARSGPATPTPQPAQPFTRPTQP